MAKEKKEKPVFNINSSKQNLLELVRECSERMMKIEIEREAIKAAKDAAKELGVEIKDFNVTVSMYHKKNRDEVEENNNRAVELFDKLFSDGFKEVHDDGEDDV
ncbi:DsbA dsDNA-binding protein [Aeromonas phage 65]|uniref:Double-stranded DNA binding protein n=2 Tax=Ishigurovirus osborne TaxID=260149 RepID=A0A219YBR6_9CAUD|nr:DsbA dsDNA-binding protein [Aeromonas phage 65]ADQ53061.1 DsbA dsDNA-binding protein [Aeromonas phage 65]APU01441.1 double-stranded DNA binding protein [Aeromonas phage 65.2]